MINSKTNSFIEKASLKHNNRYDYSKVDYINSQTKVIVICENNHEFLTRPDMHVNRGDGCRMCKNNNMYKDSNAFKKELEVIFPNLYNYELLEYNGVYNDVKIICKIHGVFIKSPNSLLKGNGCNKCYKNGKLNINSFIEKANSIHNNRYNYNQSVYVNSRTPIDIICEKHGIFKQLANNHLRGHGCNKCNRSKGEILIENLLESNNIEYKTEFIFSDLRHKYPLRFDFAIFNNSELKYLIEFNGKQHYEYYPSFHRSYDEYNESLKRDTLKIDYCKNKNIKLYILRFDSDICSELEKIIKENEQENI